MRRLATDLALLAHFAARRLRDPVPTSTDH